MEKYDDINDLLARYFAGESISGDEKIALDDWIKANPEEFGKLSVIMHKASETPDVRSFDSEKAWTKIEGRLEHRAEARRFSLRNMSVFYAAASVVLLAVVSILYFLRGSEPEAILYANSATEQETVILPDSSSVVLYPGTSIKYNELQANSVREVSLDGKAFFSVRKKNGWAFRVQSGDVKVEVMGTSFLVDVSPDELSGVYVKTGVVRVDAAGNKVVLKRNEMVEFDGDGFRTGKIENPSEIFGDDGELIFNGEPVESVARKIGETTGTVIEVEQSLHGNTVTSRISVSDVESVVRELAFLCGSKYEVVEEGKHYRLYK